MIQFLSISPPLVFLELFFLRFPKEIYQTNRFINNVECWEPFKIMRRRAWSCQSSCTWPFTESSHRLNISYFIKPSLGCRHRVSTILPFRLFQISSSLLVCVLFFFPLMSYSLRFSTIWFAPPFKHVLLKYQLLTTSLTLNQVNLNNSLNVLSQEINNLNKYLVILWRVPPTLGRP